MMSFKSTRAISDDAQRIPGAPSVVPEELESWSVAPETRRSTRNSQRYAHNFAHKFVIVENIRKQGRAKLSKSAF
jgi:hypothetical protein